MLAPLALAWLLPLLVVACVALRRWPWVPVAIAAGAMLLPFFVAREAPFWRATCALFVLMLLVKSLQFAHGHERPEGARNTLRFYLIPAVVRWDAPRRPDRAGALKALAIVAAQFALVAATPWTLERLDASPVVALVAIELCIYLVVSGALNGLAATLTWHGIDHDRPFGTPLLSRTPAEFWGRHWNTWVNHMLYRYVFLPAGGRRHPVRGTLAAFAASAAFHEYLADVGTLRFSGWMAAYFLLQGLLVVATGTKRMRRLARRAPKAAWALTLVVMIATGALFVRGADGVDPSRGWERCCSQWPL